MPAHISDSKQDRIAPEWAAMLPLLLLVCALVIPHLGGNAFTGDEPASLHNAGYFSSEAQSLTQTWSIIAERDPRQSFGWPLLLTAWSRLVGWSELAIRALPLYAGLLTFALVWRIGRDAFSWETGLAATLLLTGSAFFLTYMSVARVFCQATFFATLLVWRYLRCTQDRRPPGWVSRAALLLACAGLLYSNWYAALLLLALGLYHLLFQPKTRQWWRPVLPVAGGVLPALPQLAILADGLELTLGTTGEWITRWTVPQLLAQLIHWLGNGLPRPSPDLAATLVAILVVALVLFSLRRRHRGAGHDAFWLLTFTSVTLLAAGSLASLVTGGVPAHGDRYLLPLWPLTALAAGAGLVRLTRNRDALLVTLLSIWFLVGAGPGIINGYRFEIGYFYPSQVHRIARDLRERLPASDLLLVDQEIQRLDPEGLYSLPRQLPAKIINRTVDDPLAAVRPLHENFPYVSLLFRARDRADIPPLMEALGRTICERLLDAHGFVLERHALAGAWCPQRPARFAFDNGLTLAEPVIALRNDALRVELLLHSDDALLSHAYSLSLQLVDVNSLETVAQQDAGLGRGNVLALQPEIDVSALPAGEYALRLALYDWGSGIRSSGQDLTLGHFSDIFTLQHVFLE